MLVRSGLILREIVPERVSLDGYLYDPAEQAFGSQCFRRFDGVLRCRRLERLQFCCRFPEGWGHLYGLMLLWVRFEGGAADSPQLLRGPQHADGKALQEFPVISVLKIKGGPHSHLSQFFK